MHFAEHGWVVFQLQDPGERDSYASRFLHNYRRQQEALYRAAARLDSADFVEVRFEDLEHDPCGEIRRIYHTLGLDFSSRFQQRLVAYLARTANYQKNRFRPLPHAQQYEINDTLASLMAHRRVRRRDSAPTNSDQRRAAAA
jgi:hypothetical protein